MKEKKTLNDTLEKGENEVLVKGREVTVIVKDTKDEFCVVDKIYAKLFNVPIGAYADDLVERLNKDCPVGRNWLILEMTDKDRRIVSGTFGQNSYSHRYYEITVNEDGWDMECYQMRKGQHKREKVSFYVLKDDLEFLLKSLVDEKRGVLDDVFGGFD